MCVISKHADRSGMAASFRVDFVQSEEEAIKAAKRQIEELQRVRDTFRRQIQFLRSTQNELGKRKDAVYADYLAVKYGTNVITQRMMNSNAESLLVAKHINLYSCRLQADDAVVFMFFFNFYPATECDTRHGISKAFLSVCPSVCLCQTRGL